MVDLDAVLVSIVILFYSGYFCMFATLFSVKTDNRFTIDAFRCGARDILPILCSWRDYGKHNEMNARMLRFNNGVIY